MFCERIVCVILHYVASPRTGNYFTLAVMAYRVLHGVLKSTRSIIRPARSSPSVVVIYISVARRLTTIVCRSSFSVAVFIIWNALSVRCQSSPSTYLNLSTLMSFLTERLSTAVFEILSPKHIRVKALTLQGHVTSSIR